MLRRVFNVSNALGGQERGGLSFRIFIDWAREWGNEEAMKGQERRSG